MPSLEELASLMGPSFSSPHPFTNLAFDTDYWTATTMEADTAKAFVIAFPVAGAPTVTGIDKGAAAPRRWCVRGGAGYTGGQSDLVP
jgi:hypothetical protein